jgi:hypothetical protein
LEAQGGVAVADIDAGRSRRSFLFVGLAAATAVVANALGRPTPVEAADGDPVLAGQTVTASTTTQIHATNEGAFIARTEATGSAAIDAQSTGGSANIGVRGSADGNNSTGVLGHSGDSIGVAGSSDTGVGVMGTTANPGAIAVFGYSPEGIGVRARSNVGTALDVVGKAVFSRSGRVTILAGRHLVIHAVDGLTSSSLVFAVVEIGDSTTWVRKVVPGSGKFTVVVNKNVSSPARIAWFSIG